MRLLLGESVPIPPILFVGGKGGVGKSTLSSALACLLAKTRKTLLVSTDPAHNLSDIFEIMPSSQTQQISNTLFLREIDPLAEVKAYTAQVAKDAKQFISASSYSLLESYYENVASSGVAQESALFDRLIRIITQEQWEHIVIDTAPTGHTLRLFKLPLTMQQWSKTLLSQQEKSHNLEGIIGHLEGNPLKDRLEERHLLYSKFNNLLHSPQVGIIFVLNPESLPIEETARAIHSLSHDELKPYALAINKIPPPSDDEFFAKRYANAQKHLAAIRERFKDFWLWEIPLLSGDILEHSGLEQIIEQLNQTIRVV